MAGVINIASTSQWDTIIKSHNVVIADFYADWCGPCKMIAPTFERLANQFSTPKKVAFVKVNVDNHSSISRTHGVSAMPTFMVFHCGKAINTVRGANPSALTTAVGEALNLKDQGTPGEYFKSAGRTLGSGDARPASFDFSGFFGRALIFLGLYFASLLSFDPYKAAEKSQFNVRNARARKPAPAAGGAGATRRAAPRATFKTLSDLGKEE